MLAALVSFQSFLSIPVVDLAFLEPSQQFLLSYVEQELTVASESTSYAASG